jgi:hypothetical protein
MLYKISTSPIPNTKYVKLGLAEAKYVFRRICKSGVKQINLFESFNAGFVAQSEAPNIPEDYSPDLGINISTQFPDAVYELEEFKTAYFNYYCDIEIFDELKAETESTYQEFGIPGLEKLGWKFITKEVKLFGNLKIEVV